MISTATSSALRGNQQHRRQNSIPSNLEALTISGHATAAMHRHRQHRRGQSLDQRAIQIQPMPVHTGRNSISNAAAYHSVLRERQQQRITPQIQQYRNPPSRSLSSIECQSLNQNGMERYTNIVRDENVPCKLSLARDPYGFDIRNHSGPNFRSALEVDQMVEPQGKANLLSPSDLEQSFGENMNWDIYLMETENSAPQTSRFTPTASVYYPSTPTRKVNSSK